MLKGKKKNIEGNKKKAKGKSCARLPVTVLSGFLGTGKTTLLKHILESSKHNMKIAVIVNDMAELNIDASLVKDAGLVQAKQEIVSMQNGCICCTLRTDLIREISRLQNMGGFDYLVIESTGISEPIQVAESFVADPMTQELAENQEEMLWNTARLDTLVTVVDIREFPAMMNSLQNFNQKFASVEGEAEEEGEKNISQLLLEQVEFANVIILNKCDLVDAAQRESVKMLVQSLNPSAKILLTTYAQVDLSHIINTNLFDLEAAKVAPGWLQSLNGKGPSSSSSSSEGLQQQAPVAVSVPAEGMVVGFRAAESASESDEYGVTSFVYRRDRPFHPQRLHALLSSILNFSHADKQQARRTSISRCRVGSGSGSITPSDNSDATKFSYMQEQFGWILRSKGFAWIAGRDELMAEWAQAGRFVEITPHMYWYVDTPEDQWKIASSTSTGSTGSTGSNEAEKESIRKRVSTPVIGDRQQEIVFIGTKLNQHRLTNALDACLLTPWEFDQHDMKALGFYVDPLPAWVEQIVKPTSMWSTVLREGQTHKLQIHEGLELELGCIALNYVIPENYHSPSSTAGNASLAGNGSSALESTSMIDSSSISSSSSCFVKVWLDYEHRSTLLCTLRPERCDQVPVAITLVENDLLREDNNKKHNSNHNHHNSKAAEEAYYTLRMEVHSLSFSSLPVRKRKRDDGGNTTNMVAEELPYFEVHILGTCLAAQSQDEDQVEDED